MDVGKHQHMDAPSVERLTAQDFGIGVLFDSLSDAVVVGDADSEHVVLWNPAAEEIFGYSSEEIIGRPIHTLIPERLRDDHLRGLSRYAATGEGTFIGARISADLPAVRKDGTEIEIALSLTPVSTPRAGGRFAMAIIRDITHRRRLEEEVRENELRLQTALDEVKAQEERRKDFIGMMVHDLRTPAAVVAGFTEVLISNFDSFGKEQVSEVLARVHSQVRTMARLIDDLLTVSALESGELSYEVAPFDLGTLVFGLIRDHRAASPLHRFEVEVADGLPPVLGDERRQTQILNNLFSNAAKFSPPGSTVNVKVERDAEEVLVSVADEGPGIPEADRERIFDRFARLDQTTNVKGTGLGLFITKELVEAQGGRIWVKEAASGGACIVYSAPVAPERRGARRGRAGDVGGD